MNGHSSGSLLARCAGVATITVFLWHRQAAAVQQATDSLTLTLEAPQAEYVLGEPVYLTLRLRNDGSAAQRLSVSLSPKDGMLGIRITGPGEARLGFAPLSARDLDAPPVDLAPGSAIGHVAPVFFGARGWTFRAPGSYQAVASLRVRRDGRWASLQSNTVTISVSAADTAPGRFLMGAGSVSTEAGKFLLWQTGDHLRKGIAHLQNLVDRYPASPLADYTELALGRHLGQAFADYSVNRVRGPECDAALGHLQKVRQDRIPPYLQIIGRLAEARCHIGMNRPDAARRSLQQARALIGDHPEFRGLADEASTVERGLGGGRRE